MLPKAEIKRYDPEVEDRYNELGARRGEMREELAAVNGEINTILAELGALVASGVKYKKQIDRLADLRAESEALEAGINYLSGQSELLRRLNTWLT